MQNLRYIDYMQEQADEVEALESIFPDSLTVHAPNKVELPCEFEAGEYKGVDYSASFDITVTFTETYPETAPEIHMNNVSGYLDYKAEQLGAAKIQEVVDENLGDPLVFAVFEAMSEWLEDYLTSAKDNSENEELRAAVRAEEERLAKLTAGTECNKDTFAEWRDQFLKEVAEGKVNNYTIYIKDKKGKVTGKSQFEIAAKKKFEESNSGDSGDPKVVVDTEMFEGLDLDLEDLDIDSDED